MRTFSASFAIALALMGSAPATAQIGSGPTIKIGVSGPFSGGSQPLGESMRNGIRLATEEINAIGGINGQKIELIERDDEAKNDLGASIANDLVRQQVVATIGIVNTGVGLASIDAYQKARIPLLVAVSTGTVLTKKFAPPNAPENYIFRLAPTLDLEAKSLAAELKHRKLTSISLLADSTAYGDAGTKAFKAESAAAGITLTSEERFEVGDTDMTPQVKRAMASGSTALVVWGIGPELAVVARNREALGWIVPTFGSWTFSSLNFITGAGKAGEGVMMPQTFIQDMGSTSKNGFLLAYRRASKSDVIASPMSAAQGYDGMHLLYLAIRQANSGDGSKIREAFENLKSRYQGVITSYTKPFSKTDHDAITLNMIWIGKIAGGRVEYANSADQKRSALMRMKGQ